MKKTQPRDKVKLQLRRQAIKPLIKPITLANAGDAVGGVMCGTWFACPPKKT